MSHPHYNNVFLENQDILNGLIPRSEFSIFREYKNLSYLDNAATHQIPDEVLATVDNHHRKFHANIHRGSYKISIAQEEAYEGARKIIARYFGAQSSSEIIFTQGATAGVNMIALGYLEHQLQPGDSIVVSILEHHSNFVPWQQLAKKKNVHLKVLGCDRNGKIDAAEIEKHITKGVKLVAITMASNVLGVTTPIQSIIKAAHEVGAVVLVDGAQAASHMSIDVSALDIDFFVASSHKILSTMGSGFLYAASRHHAHMHPVFTGGGMIEHVSIDETTFLPVPSCYEPGTSNIEAAIGLGKSIEIIERIGMSKIIEYEQQLTEYALKSLAHVEGIIIYGHNMDTTKPLHSADVQKDALDSIAVISFNIEGVHPHDVASILDSSEVAIRSGFHCAKPLLDYLGLGPTCRASFSLYTTKKEIDTLVHSLESIKRRFS